jgi:hypothetical protein
MLNVKVIGVQFSSGNFELCTLATKCRMASKHIQISYSEHEDSFRMKAITV